MEKTTTKENKKTDQNYIKNKTLKQTTKPTYTVNQTTKESTHQTTTKTNHCTRNNKPAIIKQNATSGNNERQYVSHFLSVFPPILARLTENGAHYGTLRKCEDNGGEGREKGEPGFRLRRKITGRKIERVLKASWK